MMVETILESSQEFGMSNGVLPQWKRELLQRRAARSRPSPPSPPAPPAPPLPPPEDEELRYGPGIVKRLKSRYLSLALRDAPRRRPSVLRRAASLEHLLDERPPPAPRPPRPRPVSFAPLPPRRDSVKRARSVDALSRLDAREDPAPPPPPPPQPPAPPATDLPRAPRPPRRPTPLLRETERPPPDLVKSTLRKFESAPPRRSMPAARVSAVLRGLEGRTSTPEPSSREQSPSPPATDLSAIDELGPPKTVSRAALDGIALAGSTVRYSFESPKCGSHLPLVCAANPVLLNRARASPRRVGVIRPMPSPALERATSTPVPLPEDVVEKLPDTPPVVSPPPAPAAEPDASPRREPPSALVEPIPRTPPVGPKEPSPPRDATPEPEPKAGLNGHAEERERSPVKLLKSWKAESDGSRKSEAAEKGAARSWTRGGSPAARRRPPAPAATSVVFNFSARKDVPDYIENDGIILRNKRDKIKATDPGVVVLREPARADADADSGSDTEPDGPPSPCAVRFVNDNVLINGRSSMPHKPDRQRTARLKIQFDDSLTRTFEYPSETSFAEESPPSPAPTATPAVALASNTHIASAALSRYTPSKTLADAFQLGVTRLDDRPPAAEVNVEAADAGEEGDARPCAADAARSWSESRTLATDLLFW